MILYFDTSALVKGYIQEEGSKEVIALMDEVDNLFGSVVLTQVEMAAAIQRAVRVMGSSSKIASAAWQDFLDDWPSFTRLAVSPMTIERASVIAWNHGIRGYDSLHLAAALLWQETLGSQITLATFDRELWVAGHKAGMLSWPEKLVSE
jgi:predicted nucleic acid-binding protein